MTPEQRWTIIREPDVMLVSGPVLEVDESIEVVPASRAAGLHEALEELERAATRWYVFVMQAERELYPGTPTLKDAVAKARAALEKARV